MAPLNRMKEVLEYLADYFIKNKELNSNDLSDLLSPELKESAYLNYTLAHLINDEGALVEKRVKGDIIYEAGNLENLKCYIDLIEEEEKEKEDMFKDLEDSIQADTSDQPTPEIQSLDEPISTYDKIDALSSIFVYSIPDSKRKEMMKVRKRYSQYKIVELSVLVKSLLANAEREVLITSPFMDYDGINIIKDELKLLVKKKVKLKILTRNISLKSYTTSEYAHSRKLIGIRSIFYIFQAESNANLFQIKEFDLNLNPSNKNLSVHSEGFHQKMIIVDDHLCYIGSGELTIASMRINGECGILLKGNIAKLWKDFFYIFWNSKDAKNIELEKIEYYLQ